VWGGTKLVGFALDCRIGIPLLPAPPCAAADAWRRSQLMSIKALHASRPGDTTACADGQQPKRPGSRLAILDPLSRRLHPRGSIEPASLEIHSSRTDVVPPRWHYVI
jgi:hypothetical protein